VAIRNFRFQFQNCIFSVGVFRYLFSVFFLRNFKDKELLFQINFKNKNKINFDNTPLFNFKSIQKKKKKQKNSKSNATKQETKNTNPNSHWIHWSWSG